MQDIDDCVDNKCANGRCKDGINSYVCDCNATGYEGELCEIGNMITMLLVVAIGRIYKITSSSFGLPA